MLYVPRQSHLHQVIHLGPVVWLRVLIFSVNKSYAASFCCQGNFEGAAEDLRWLT